VANPDKVILFGSRAKGSGRSESDYDILVLKTGVKNLRELSRKIYRNFSRIGASVDVVVYDTDQYEKQKDDPSLIYREADKHGQVLFEKQ
jgi:predicted nucleotidyltransferase